MHILGLRNYVYCLDVLLCIGCDEHGGDMSGNLSLVLSLSLGIPRIGYLFKGD